MVISDAIERIDSVLNAEPMSIGNYPQKPKSASIELENIHFLRYIYRDTCNYERIMIL